MSGPSRTSGPSTRSPTGGPARERPGQRTARPIPEPTALALAVSIGLAVAVGAILFGAAGRWDVPRFWAYLAVLLALNVAGVGVTSPELTRERLHPGPGERDRLSRLLIVPVLGAHWLLAGLDARPGPAASSDHLHRLLQAVGLVAFAGGMVVALWAVRSNPFFSSAVRIQSERGQRVIDDGPYRFVRHPGYSGALVAGLGSALALGSAQSLVPIVIGDAVLVWRTALEDRMLRAELPSYADYAARVRHRLVPGLW